MDRFIRKNLKQGVDFAKSFRSAGKETLLKPGSEKVCVLLNLMPVFKDEEATLSHLSENVRSSTITFLCELVNRSTGVKIPVAVVNPAARQRLTIPDRRGGDRHDNGKCATCASRTPEQVAQMTGVVFPTA